MTETRKQAWVKDLVETPAGTVPLVRTTLGAGDRLRNALVRLGFGRDRYAVPPGLYGVGSPDEESPVLVTSNYKLTFDALRKELAGIACWILVLDTRGINVWCAAGKRTFSTGELVDRMAAVRLKDLVRHRTLVLPQLGAPGMSAHLVRRETGFRVVYGPVRACDVPAFLRGGMKKDEAMRTVRFSLKDRLVLVPVELAFAVVVLLAGFILVTAADWVAYGSLTLGAPARDFIPFLGAVLVGCVVVPLLLPLVPGRSFAVKGLAAGIVYAAVINAVFHPSLLDRVTTSILILTTSSLFALFFTGSTTFTSVSGVRREVRIAFPVLVPLLAASILTGLVSKLVTVRHLFMR